MAKAALPAHSRLEEGERETQLEIERAPRTDNLDDRLSSRPRRSSPKWKECSRDEPVIAFPQTGREKE